MLTFREWVIILFLTGLIASLILISILTHLL